MSDSHLMNTIRLLERETDRATDRIIMDGYAVLGTVQGEMAEMAIESELAALEQYGLDSIEAFPILVPMLYEAKRRNLL